MAKRRKKAGDRWLALACGPSSELYWKRALLKCNKTATCNRGLERIPQPDIYVVVEMECVMSYQRHYQQAQAGGTTLITIDRLSAADLRGMDVILPVQSSPHEYDMLSWVPGEYRNSSTSGGFMVQYIASLSPSEIHLVGFDGYPASKGPTEFIKTWHYQGPLFARMAEVMPSTQFIFYGTPLYDVATDLPNVSIKESE
jgi:hypothetical protein